MFSPPPCELLVVGSLFKGQDLGATLLPGLSDRVAEAPDRAITAPDPRCEEARPIHEDEPGRSPLALRRVSGTDHTVSSAEGKPGRRTTGGTSPEAPQGDLRPRPTQSENAALSLVSGLGRF